MNEPEHPLFLIVIDEDRDVFSIEGPMTDPGSPLHAKHATR
jgi:hypothetical protein